MGQMTTTAVAPDFADVYALNLDKVWRFVRARISDHHEAHDVTSDVFVRAWRSWDRYDPSRGAVEPWLFTIAHRTIIDRHRRAHREQPTENQTLDGAAIELGPEEQVLRDELLAQLAQALDALSPRERDGLALRFAARLSLQHVADVLDVSLGAAKMLLHRAIRRLGDRVAVPAPADQEPADLEAVIDDVLARGHQAMGDSSLHELLVHLAVIQDSPTPDGLADHVAYCVQCAVEEDNNDDSGGSSNGSRPSTGGGPTTKRSRIAGLAASLLAFTGVCLVCTIPALQTLTWALGVGLAGYYLHLVGIAATPIVLWLVYRGVRRHGVDRGYRWARLGTIFMGLHAIMHIIFETVESAPAWLETVGTIAWVTTDWSATALLLVGAVLNLVDLNRWRTQQARQFIELRTA